MVILRHDMVLARCHNHRAADPGPHGSQLGSALCGGNHNFRQRLGGARDRRPLGLANPVRETRNRNRARWCCRSARLVLSAAGKSKSGGVTGISGGLFSQTVEGRCCILVTESFLEKDGIFGTG